MIQGTTPTHIFTLPFDGEIIHDVRIIYSQNDKVVFVKNSEDCTIRGNEVSTKLSQEETFLIDRHESVEIQLRILTTTGEALASVPKKVSVVKCLENEVFT